jgi:subtilisin family serine protease
VSDAAAIREQYNLRELDKLRSLRIFRMGILDGALPQEKAAALAADARVVFADINYVGQAPEARKQSGWAIGGDVGGFAAQWAPGALRLGEAHATSLGAGVTVAVLDTGIDPEHPLFAGRLVAGYDFVDNDPDPREEGEAFGLAFGHGTHVAGLVALAAPEAKIMPIRVLDPDGRGSVWALARGLEFAVDPDDNPQTNDGAQVINLSLGTTQRTSLLDEITGAASCDAPEHTRDAARMRAASDDVRCGAHGGAVVVAAAGNQGDTAPHYPAAEAVQGLLAVAASTPGNQLAPFSTRGTWVTLAAPGERIISAVPGNRWGVWSGTSMAAPLVAGVMALVRAANPSMTSTTTLTGLVAAHGAAMCGTPLRRADAAAALGQPDNPDPLACRSTLPMVGRP